MIIDVPPAIIYEVPPSNNFSISAKEIEKEEFPNEVVEKKEKTPISVMAFGLADPNLGVNEPNTKVHFYDHYDETMNAKIIKSKHTAMQYSSMILPVRGSSAVAVQFNLTEEDLAREELGLYLTHLSSDLHQGTYDSAIEILINGKMFCAKYVPPSHDWIFDDHFDLSRFVRNKALKPGKNTVEIRLHRNAVSNYWIHCIKIM